MEVFKIPTHFNMRKPVLYLILPFLLIFSNIHAINQPRVDSLLNVIETAPVDSNYVQTLFMLAEQFYNENPDSAFHYCSEAQLISVQLNYYEGIADSYNWIGYIFWQKGDLANAIDQFSLGLETNLKTNDSVERANMLNNIGYMYKEIGDIETALDYLHQALELKKLVSPKANIATSLNNIGIIHQDLEEYETALKYFEESLELRIEAKDSNGISTTYSNIGSIYDAQGDIEKAKMFFYKALKAQSKLNPKMSHKSLVLNNLGRVFTYEEQYDSATLVMNQSLEICRSIESPYWEARTLFSLSKMHLKQGNKKVAKELALDGYNLSIKGGFAESLEDLSYLLYNIYFNENDSKNALKFYKEYIVMRDSLSSITNKKAAYKQEVNFEFQKKEQELEQQQAIEKAVLLKEKEKTDALNKKEQQEKNVIIGFVSAIGVLVLIFAIFIFSRLKITSRQKNIIEKQKKQVDHAYNELEVKNEEIMDSITYAKRIQSAILPPNKIVKTYLQHSFILYKPKDIVAGDFYWMESRGSKVLFAAADCTGHGVPGAMVSVICNNGLNRSVREHNLTDPGKILDKTREIVIEEFAKSEEEVKDGMDIALCSLEGKTLQYAGAHNPLWIIRNGEVIETKANKQPIGKFDNPTDYTTHTFQLEEGDTIYIFSDGYVDQFGGEKGKKFKARPLKELLVSIQDKSMEEQKSIIDNAFEKWKGDLEQVDDVCVIGVRV